MDRSVLQEGLPLVFVLTTFVVLGGAVVAVSEIVGDDQPSESILADPSLDQRDIGAFTGGDQSTGAGQPNGLSGGGDIQDLNATIRGVRQNGTVGYDVATGDVDGDGYQDLLISAPAAANDSDPETAGANHHPTAAYLFYGPIEGETITTDDADVTFTGGRGDGTGWSVAIGNLSDDANGDLVIGAPFDARSNDDNVSQGVVYVVSGAQLSNATIDVSSEAYATYYGVEDGDRAGHAIAVSEGPRRKDRSTAGNAKTLSQSGRASGALLVGAPNAGPVDNGTGAAYLIESVAPGRHRLDEAANTSFAGVSEGDGAGWAVALADVTADGHDEVLIGAPFNDSTKPDAGAVYVLSTNPNRLRDADAQREGAASRTNIIPVDSGHTLVGVEEGDAAGFALAPAGQVLQKTSDGPARNRGPDVAISAPFSDSNGIDAGTVYIVGDATFDQVDAEGSDRRTSLSEAEATIRGEGARDRTGWSVAGGTELRCNRYDDLVVGAPFRNGTGTESGSAYVLKGGLDGEQQLGETGVRLDGAAAYDRAGWSVLGVADLTGDDATDLLVGAPFADTAASDSGVAYLLGGDCVPTPDEKPDRPKPDDDRDHRDKDQKRDDRDRHDKDQNRDRGDRNGGDRDRPDRDQDGSGSNGPSSGDGARAIDSCTVIDQPGVYAVTSDIRSGNAGVCLRISSSDVVFEGNGHLIQGEQVNDSVGVQVATQNQSTIENVTVRNLRVTNWHRGIDLGNFSHLYAVEATLSNVESEDNRGTGIFLAGASGSELTNTSASGNGGSGITLWETDNVQFRDVTVADNEGLGLWLHDNVAESEFVRVTATGNADNGIKLGTEVYRNTISESTVADNGDHGIEIGRDSDGSNVIRATTVEGNDGVGIRVLADAELEDVVIDENEGKELDARTDYSQRPLSASGLQVGDDVTFEFTNQSLAIEIADRASLPDLPASAQAVGDGVDLDSVGNATVAFQYDDANESQVELWRYNGTTWASVETAEATGDEITAELTEDGTYAAVEVTANASPTTDDEATATTTPGTDTTTAGPTTSDAPTTDEPTAGPTPASETPTTDEPTPDPTTTAGPLTTAEPSTESTTSEPSTEEPTTGEPPPAEPTSQPTSSEPISIEVLTEEPTATAEPTTSASAVEEVTQSTQQPTTVEVVSPPTEAGTSEQPIRSTVENTAESPTITPKEPTETPIQISTTSEPTAEPSVTTAESTVRTTSQSRELSTTNATAALEGNTTTKSTANSTATETAKTESTSTATPVANASTGVQAPASSPPNPEASKRGNLSTEQALPAKSNSRGNSSNTSGS